jgi:hypothetical protein
MAYVNFNRTIWLLCFYLLLTGCTSVSSEAQTVYITKTGAKYHEGGCRYLSKSKIPVTLKIAKEQGYGPCSVCSPVTEVEDAEEAEVVEAPDTVAAPAPLMRTRSKPVQAPVQKATASPSAQCSAFTRAGARCKRAASTNGKCWQHQ